MNYALYDRPLTPQAKDASTRHLRPWTEASGEGTMNRRDFLAAGMAALAGSAAAQSSKKKPNFIVIFADDLGYGDLACYGSRTNQSPHLDRMAKEGVRFTDCYVPMPFCAPSRASLLTGRYPFRHGITGNPAPDSGINDIGLAQKEVTIAEALKPLGYASICIGKWHLGHKPEFLPRTQGFDEYYGILYSNDMRPVQIVHNEKVAQYPVVQSNLTRDYTEKAIAFIEKNHDKPFFLYLPHAMPHKPLAASEDFYTPDTPSDLYADVIRELDWSVGQILEKVKHLGLDNDTLVLFLSDNGPWFGGSTAGLRGMKGATWDGGIRVPLIARWPGRIPAGRVNREVCSSVDLFPTLCALAGAKPPAQTKIDGLDIFPLMTSDTAKSPHEAIFAMSGPELHVVRSGKWKLHVRVPAPGFQRLDDAAAAKWVDPRGPDGVTLIAQFEQARPNQYPGAVAGDAPKPMMLFDMEADPAETRDISADHPDVVQRLQKLFEKINADAPKAGPPERHGAGGVRRLTGGQLRYDRLPKPRSLEGKQ
jgi:arylsulfatase A-like enzyme